MQKSSIPKFFKERWLFSNNAMNHENITGQKKKWIEKMRESDFKKNSKMKKTQKLRKKMAP